MASEEYNDNIHYQIVRGYPFPNSPWFSKQNIEDTMDYVPIDEDVIIASYPKTGTTWMQYIILQIMSRGKFFPSFNDVTSKIAPFMEMIGVAAVESLVKPRMYKHHLAYNLVQKNAKAKVIYIYRNPEDTVVSYYHFVRDMNPENQVTIDSFVDSFVSGKIAYGSYFQHILSFYEHRNDPNLLMVSYEKLQVDRRKEILRIAKFLGEEHHTCLMKQKDVLDAIIEHTDFKYMKENLFLIRPDHWNDEKDTEDVKAPKVNFFRKGVIGDGKNTLSVEQRRKIKEVSVEFLKGTSVLKEWYTDDS